jgi:hypothetical protein
MNNRSIDIILIIYESFYFKEFNYMWRDLRLYGGGIEIIFMSFLLMKSYTILRGNNIYPCEGRNSESLCLNVNQKKENSIVSIHHPREYETFKTITPLA